MVQNGQALSLGQWVIFSMDLQVVYNLHMT